MSIIVSVKINDGIVMAADSATTFMGPGNAPYQIYGNVNKVVHLVKNLPVGVMTCGTGGIGNASIATLLKDLRQRLSGGAGKAALSEQDQDKSKDAADWRVDPEQYTMAQLAQRVHEFFTEKARAAPFAGFLLLRICGYSSGAPLPEMWQVLLENNDSPAPRLLQPEKDFGLRWSGENEALDRLVLGLGSHFVSAAVSSLKLTKEQANEAAQSLYPELYETLILPAAPIQDAIDLARFMVETTKGFIKFSVTKAKTVGGPVEIAAITKHEGFKWIQRKHFYSADMNRGE